MGHNFMVYTNRAPEEEGQLRCIYAGDSFLEAMREMIKEKEKWDGYVKLEWCG